MSVRERRDILWEEAFKYYYNFFYLENLSGYYAWLFSWIVRILNTLTLASIAGIFYLNQSGNTEYLAYLSGFAFILTLMQFFSFSDKGNEWRSISNHIHKYRIELEGLREEIRSDFNFPIESTQKKLQEYNKIRSNFNTQEFISCGFNLEFIKSKVQKKINSFLEPEIQNAR